MRVRGVLLAGGAGRRHGGPKALIPGALAHAVDALTSGGCDAVTVVLGAAADDARALVPDGATVRVARDWATGMSAALRTGLDGLDADAALIHLVDLPDVGPPVVRRVLAHAGPAVLARAVYHAVPGHPVLLGREHRAGVIAAATGDRGARDYLDGRRVLAVECADLATGADVDYAE